MRGGIVEDLQKANRRVSQLEQCAVAKPVMQCHHEGCQWREKQAEIDRLRAKCERLEKTLKDIRRFVADTEAKP
jgi:hypothetical protein